MSKEKVNSEFSLIKFLGNTRLKYVLDFKVYLEMIRSQLHNFQILFLDD